MRSRPFINPGLAAAVAEREAMRERELTKLRALCAGQRERIIAQESQIQNLRRQVARARGKLSTAEAAE